MGVLEFCIERHHGMTAWVIGDLASLETPLKLKSLSTDVGPAQAVTSAKIEIYDSEITLRTIVNADDPLVEIEITVNWLERGTPERGVPMLRMRFPISLSDAKPRYETPFGTVERELNAREEVPTQRWADLTGKISLLKEGGVLVANDSKYGYSLEENTLRVTLLRGSYDPDPIPDLGLHTIRLGVMPHSGGSWKPGDCVVHGSRFNQPLQVVGTGVQEGEYPTSFHTASTETPGVILAGIKKTEGADSIIVRLYEVNGSQAEAEVVIDAKLMLQNGSAVEVDILEEPPEHNTASYSDGKLSVTVPAYGIVSVMLG